jgi:acetylglutamate/LysW-gamma-L-alpha-aminoadipate kinase
LIEAPGFLENPQDSKSLIRKMTQNELKIWEEQVSGRIKRKLLALRKLLESGASTIIISDGRVEHPLNEALQGKGTIIQ